MYNTYITSTVGAAFFADDSLCVDLQTVYLKARNANPLDVELEPDFNAK